MKKIRNECNLLVEHLQFWVQNSLPIFLCIKSVQDLNISGWASKKLSKETQIDFESSLFSKK